MSDKTFAAPAFKNEKTIDVPIDLFPLEGSITVPVVLSPEQFHKFWQAVNQEDEKSPYHGVIETYKSRIPLIVRSNLKFAGQPVEITDDPMALPDQAIAPFVISATQDCVTRATRLPILPKPSMNGTKA